jgi:hypothetical protein
VDVEKKQQILRQKQMMRKGEKNGSFLLGYCNKCFYCLNAFSLYCDIAGQFKKKMAPTAIAV